MAYLLLRKCYFNDPFCNGSCTYFQPDAIWWKYINIVPQKKAKKNMARRKSNNLPAKYCSWLWYVHRSVQQNGDMMVKSFAANTFRAVPANPEALCETMNSGPSGLVKIIKCLIKRRRNLRFLSNQMSFIQCFFWHFW